MCETVDQSIVGADGSDSSRARLWLFTPESLTQCPFRIRRVSFDVRSGNSFDRSRSTEVGNEKKYICLVC